LNGSSSNRESSVWQSVELPHDVRARIERDLAEGYVVLVPRKAILMEGQSVVGWWRVDPRNGQTLGIGENGWGLSASETLLLISVYLEKMWPVFYYGSILCVGGTQIVKGEVPDQEVLKCGLLSFTAAIGNEFTAIGVLLALFLTNVFGD
jgi:hypothetical protein